MKPSKSSDKKTSVSSALARSLSNASGAVLLTVVIIIVIIGLAGVAIYSLTYTSTFTQLQSQNATKAYYIAESGSRVVAAEYNNASDKNDVLENQLHGKTLTLPNPAGQFDVRVYPYWFYVNSAYNANDPSIQVKMPGGIPLQNPEDPASPRISLPSSGQVKLQEKTLLATYTTTDTSPSDGDIITLAFPDADKRFPYNIDPGEELFLVYKDSNTSSQTNVDVGDSIDLYGNNDVAQMLPAENGSFRIYNEINDKMDYSYKERIIGPGAPPAFIRLDGIDNQNSNNASVFPFSIDSNSELYFGKNLAVFSTSSFGQGNMAAKKTVGNYTDVGLDGGFSKGKDTISFEKDIADFTPTMNDPTPGNPSDPNPIEIDTIQKTIQLGSNLPGGYGSVWYKGDSDIANCIAGECLLGRGIRAYLEFQFDGTDTFADSTEFGDGFTFSLVSGANYTDGDTGAGSEYMGYAGPGLSSNGLQPPKLAVEIDTYPNPGAGNVCGSNSRRDDGDANHAALVYWGEETVGSFDAQGGYLRIGSAAPFTGDPEDWSSPQGTISFWFKRDNVFYGDGGSSGDRLWGQNVNMETRFNSTGSNFSLDWGAGGENAINTTNPFTGIDTWYFIAITWNDATDQLKVYSGNETAISLLAENLTWGGDMSAVGLITENLFLNSSGGNSSKNFGVNGKGSDLRYYDIARDLTQIQSDYKTRLSGSEAGLQAYFPLQADLIDAGPSGITATAIGTTGWSADTVDVSGFDCGIGTASYDDNRHGAGGTFTPQNSLNSNAANGYDGYHQVTGFSPNWLEDGLAHLFRIEMLRPLLDDPVGSGLYKYQIKVWILKPTDLTASELAQFKDVRADFAAWGPLIKKTIKDTNNPLMLNEIDHEDLKRVLFGFTQGTGGATQNITLRDLELYFLRQYPVSDLATW
jgi:hypothetical protein